MEILFIVIAMCTGNLVWLWGILLWWLFVCFCYWMLSMLLSYEGAM